MSDRGVIAAHWLRNSITDDMEHDDNDWSTFCQCGHRIADTTATDIEALHRAHVVAALRESRTVRTQEEAMALPPGSIIIDAENDTMKHYGGDHWCALGNCDRWNARDFEYPARVLYRPDEDGGV